MQNTSNLWPKLALVFFASQVISALYLLLVLSLIHFYVEVPLFLTPYQTSLFIIASPALSILFCSLGILSYKLWNRYLNK